MKGFLLDLLGFFGVNMIVVSTSVAIVFRKELMAAWRDYKAEKANRQ